MKSIDGDRLEAGAFAQLTVMPWWVMSCVWLTVTVRFANSASMNDSDPVPPARSAFGFSSVPPSLLVEPVIGWFEESSRPLAQLTVTADAVDPTPVIWL